MRVAVVAGLRTADGRISPEAGHAIPAIALCLRFLAAGDQPVLVIGRHWLDMAGAAGIEAVEMRALDRDYDDDDVAAWLHERSAQMAVLNKPVLQGLRPDLVVVDAMTAWGGMAADLLGVPWVGLDPHPLYLPSRGLPPIGSGLMPGTGLNGLLRDSMLRALAARSTRAGQRRRAAARAGIGLPASDPGPRRRLVATLPALEVPRPDWPAEAFVVGPLHFEPPADAPHIPSGDGPIVMVAPSTSTIGVSEITRLVLEHLVPGHTLPAGSRLVVSRLGGDDVKVPPWATVGRVRQDELLRVADVVVCGGGHGMLSKTLLAGVPVVVVPGGGDQWELANRVVRQGSGRLVRPLTAESLVSEVAEVLADPRYREAARRAGESVADVADPVQVCHAAAQ